MPMARRARRRGSGGISRIGGSTPTGDAAGIGQRRSRVDEQAREAGGTVSWRSMVPTLSILASAAMLGRLRQAHRWHRGTPRSGEHPALPRDAAHAACREPARSPSRGERRVAEMKHQSPCSTKRRATRISATKRGNEAVTTIARSPRRSGSRRSRPPMNHTSSRCSTAGPRAAQGRAGSRAVSTAALRSSRDHRARLRHRPQPPRRSRADRVPAGSSRAVHAPARRGRGEPERPCALPSAGEAVERQTLRGRP